MEPFRVLLVDDNAIFRANAARFLSRQESVAVVGAARGGAEALALTRKLRPDVILLDLTLPGMSGLQVVPLLRDVLPGVGIIVVTLLDTAGYREAALSEGADGFVSKADIMDLLVPTILRVGRLPRSPEEHPQAYS